MQMWWRRLFGTTTPGFRRRKREAAGQALLFLLGGFGVAYFISELALSQMVHPIHWGTAAASGALLYAGAYFWTLRRLFLQQAAQKGRRSPGRRRSL